MFNPYWSAESPFPTEQIPQAMKDLLCPLEVNLTFSTKPEVLEILWKVTEKSEERSRSRTNDCYNRSWYVRKMLGIGLCQRYREKRWPSSQWWCHFVLGGNSFLPLGLVICTSVSWSSRHINQIARGFQYSACHPVSEARLSPAFKGGGKNLRSQVIH